MGANTPTTNDRSNPMRRSTRSYTPTDPPAPVPQNRTVTVEVVNPSRCMFYRDEIFDVTVTVTNTSEHYDGTIELKLSEGETYQTLGNRRNVRMFHFTGGTEAVNSEGEPVTLISFGQEDWNSIPIDDSGTTISQKRLKAVINIAQIVKIQATQVDAHGEPTSLSAETEDIHIGYKLRQYTTKHSNDTVNSYDEKIIDQLNCWDDWNIGAPPDPPEQTPPDQAEQTPPDPPEPVMPYTFMTDARPSGELVKAVAYKASRLATRANPDDPENLNLMRITADTLLCMTTGTPETPTKERRDVNASALGDPDSREEADGSTTKTIYLGTYLGDGDAAPLMDYGTPTVLTIDHSLKWGIRWLIAKRTHQVHTSTPQEGGGDPIEAVTEVRRINWWVHDGAVRAYWISNGQGGIAYLTDVRRLYAEGRNPRAGQAEQPTYLWPIKADGFPRQ